MYLMQLQKMYFHYHFRKICILCWLYLNCKQHILNFVCCSKIEPKNYLLLMLIYKPLLNFQGQHYQNTKFFRLLIPKLSQYLLYYLILTVQIFRRNLFGCYPQIYVCVLNIHLQETNIR